MSGNTFGRLFAVTTFGESHGSALGCVVDGCPAGVPLTLEAVARELARRRPNGGAASTSRQEADEPEILSGVFEGRTLGTPIALIVRNRDQKSGDYDALRDVYRPGHADWTWEAKFGRRDHRGGGRSSGRETVGRVAAGAVAKAFLAGYGVVIRAWTSSAAGIDVPGPLAAGFDLAFAEENFLRVPHRGAFEEISAKIERLRAEGDSAGGVVSCVVTGVPPGLGEPVFDKLDARLASAMLSLGAAKGVEFGSGFASAYGCGSSLNDQPVLPPAAGGFALSAASDADGNRYDGAANPATPSLCGVSGEKKAVSPADARPAFKANNAGGILGGIANGMPVEFRVAFKPVASISKKQAAVDCAGKVRELVIQGRHDVCIAPRAVPVVEAMAALVLADMALLSRGNR